MLSMIIVCKKIRTKPLSGFEIHTSIQLFPWIVSLIFKWMQSWHRRSGSLFLTTCSMLLSWLGMKRNARKLLLACYTLLFLCVRRLLSAASPAVPFTFLWPLNPTEICISPTSQQLLNSCSSSTMVYIKPISPTTHHCCADIRRTGEKIIAVIDWKAHPSTVLCAYPLDCYGFPTVLRSSAISSFKAVLSTWLHTNKYFW